MSLKRREQLEIANQQRKVRPIKVAGSPRFSNLVPILLIFCSLALVTAIALVLVTANYGVTPGEAYTLASQTASYASLLSEIINGAFSKSFTYVLSSTLLPFFIWIPFLLLEIIAHESGHVVAGRVVGFRFLYCTIGPLKITSTPRGFEFGYNENWRKVAGSAASVPTYWHDIRRREMIMVAGGPIASLLLGCTALVLTLLTARSNSTHSLFEVAAFVSLFSFVANVLPLKSGGFLSDGARIKMLALGGPAAERYCALVSLVGAAKSGQRPRDWNPEWIAHATLPADGSLDDIGGSHVGYYWAADIGDLYRAGQLLDYALAATLDPKLPPRVRWLIQVDQAFFHAYYRKDALTARGFLNMAGPCAVNRDRFMHLRAEAATFLTEGDPSRARAHALEGLALLEQQSPGEAGWQLDREWLEALAGSV